MFKNCCGILNSFIDKGLDIGRKINPQTVACIADNWVSSICGLLMYLIGIVYFLRSIIYAIKCESMDFIWMGLGMLAASVLMNYIGSKVLSNIRGLYSKTVSKLRSNAILDCIALLCVLLGIGALVLGFKVDMGIGGILGGILLMLIFLLVALTALSPAILAVELNETCSAGEELIGLLTFFMKNFLFVLPYLYIVGLGYLLYILLFQLGIQAEYSSIMVMMTPPIIVFGLLPLMAYFLYLAYYFILDLCRAILSIGK